MDLVFWNGDLNGDALGADDPHDGFQGCDVLTDFCVERGDGSTEGGNEDVFHEHGIGQIHRSMRLLKIGNHLFPFDFGETSVVMDFLKSVVGVLGLIEGGLS